MGIPASQRLRKQSDFQQVRRSEHRIHCGPFIVQCELSGEGGEGGGSPPMLGVIASRRVGNAVKRNRGKRLIREIFRRNFRTLPMLPMLPMLPIGSRFVVVLRSGFDRYGFFELEAHFLKACGKITRKAGPGERSK